jgi:hypothetical protein
MEKILDIYKMHLTKMYKMHSRNFKTPKRTWQAQK